MSGLSAGTSSGGDTPVREIARLLSTPHDVTLCAHVNPDADSLGSALALGMALRRAGTERVRVSFGSPAEVPASLRDLDPDGLVVPPDAVPEVPPTVVVLDAGSAERLGRLGERVAATRAAGGQVIVIDHHVGNTRFGTHHLIDETAVATALIVFDLLDEMGAVIDLPIARCLYAGLVTDSRLFRQAGPAAHRTAARLLEAGVDPQATVRPLLDSHPFSWLGMLSAVLGDATLEPTAARGFGLVHATVPLSYWQSMRSEEVDSVIDIIRTTSEAEVAAVFKEVAPERWSVSLRANSRIDVGYAATLCGGGGHRLASGFTTEATVESLRDAVRRALEEAPLLG